ncbi:elongation factor P--(R)-beta-lysine ligase [Colwellia asteriadis]|uniref:Elongation factor P--(R)-beta-lysine ligase n=1 Tax=Colwellia asteriadis TaxID=517723 RepID=A0ABP3WIJ8_9GAMM
MSWQTTLSWENAKKRSEILQQIRNFFSERNVTEVETPALSQGTVTDVYLDALSCEYNYDGDSLPDQARCLYLQTSPEFHMKRLLASGYGCIYQIAKAFRHEEMGRHHNPEFTMLEWYRVGFDHFKLMAEVEALLIDILGCAKPVYFSYQAIFEKVVAIDPLNTTQQALLSLLEKKGKLSDWLIEDSQKDDDNDLLLQFIFSEIIEPTIGLTSPCFIYDFPRSQASLAKISTGDSRVAERFECYFKGVELANGFNELTDAKQQQSRFEHDNLKRSTLALDTKPIDKNFIAALEQGFPNCAGVALGVDRLVMLALGAEDIADVLSFPISRA